MAAFDLLVVGEINPDFILRGQDVTPAFGQAEKLVEAASLTIGSSSVIMACGAARLGLRTAFIGLVGDDAFGHFMLRSMDRRGINTSACVMDEGVQTGMSVILSRPQDRAILTFPGAIAALRHEQIDGRMLARSRHLHVSSFFLLDDLRPDLPRLFSEAKEQGLSTSLDTNWDPRGCWDGGLDALLAVCDVFLPNAAEVEAITGLDFEPGLDELAARIPTLAVKMGPEGGLAREKDATASAAALEVSVVDTTGAGDSFDAGFLYGYLNDWSLAKSIRLAAICGSLSTRAAGGTDAQPTIKEAAQWGL